MDIVKRLVSLEEMAQELSAQITYLKDMIREEKRQAHKIQDLVWTRFNGSNAPAQPCYVSKTELPHTLDDVFLVNKPSDLYLSTLNVKCFTIGSTACSFDKSLNVGWVRFEGANAPDYPCCATQTENLQNLKSVYSINKPSNSIFEMLNITYFKRDNNTCLSD